MTLIIWKDGVICADRCVTSGDIGRAEKKLKRLGNSVCVFTGPVDFGASLLRWADKGFDPKEFPPTQARDDYAILLQARPRGLAAEIRLFYQTPDPVVQASWGAIGIGAEFALGALFSGYDAESAMMLAQKHIPRLGHAFGYDAERYF